MTMPVDEKVGGYPIDPEQLVLEAFDLCEQAQVLFAADNNQASVAASLIAITKAFMAAADSLECIYKELGQINYDNQARLEGWDE